MKRLPHIAVLFFICITGCESKPSVEEKAKTTEKTPESSKDNGKAVEWGNLTGRFIFDGKAPVPVALAIDKNKEVCCASGCPKDESLLVSPKGGLANVVIYVRSQVGISLAVHPDYKKTESAKVYVDTKGCKVKPHILVMRTSQTLVLSNSDPVSHNTNAFMIKNDAFNILLPPKTSREFKFEKTEPLPARLHCDIHPWTNSYLAVRDDPHTTVSGEDGRFTMKNLPVEAELEFQVWHEKPGYVKTVSIGGTATEWERGRFKMTIKPGDNDLGEIKLSPELFK